MKQVPFLLIYSRLLMAIVIAMIALAGLPGARIYIVVLMTAGLVTDILDGIMARRLGVATQQLRVWDSNTDQFFWLVILVCIFGRNIPFLKDHYPAIGIIAGLEALAYLFSFVKFRRTVATHSWLAKVWTLTLFAFLADLCLHSQSNAWFRICALLGIVSRLEIILIIVILKEWTVDVPSVLSLVWIKRKTSTRAAAQSNREEG